MGKQAKKKQKSEAQLATQKNHNRATKGVNTNRRGSLWARRKYIDEVDGVKVEKFHNVFVPPKTLWDPMDPNKNDPRKATSEPWNALHLDWCEEIVHYALENEAKLGRLIIDEGMFLYRVYRGENIEEPDEVLLEVQSPRKFVNVRDNKRRTKKAG